MRSVETSTKEMIQLDKCCEALLVGVSGVLDTGMPEDGMDVGTDPGDWVGLSEGTFEGGLVEGGFPVEGVLVGELEGGFPVVGVVVGALEGVLEGMLNEGEFSGVDVGELIGEISTGVDVGGEISTGAATGGLISQLTPSYPGLHVHRVCETQGPELAATQLGAHGTSWKAKKEIEFAFEDVNVNSDDCELKVSTAFEEFTKG